MAGFHADLDELLDVIDLLADGHAGLEALASGLARDLALLHGSWNGLAASAHAETQARWDDGFGSMRSALGAMRAAAVVARDSYAAAADLNRAAWAELG